MGLSNSIRRQNMEDNDVSDRESTESTASEPDMMTVLQYLIRNNAQMRIITNESNQSFEDDSEEDEANKCVLQPAERCVYLSRIDASQFKQDTMLLSGSLSKHCSERPNTVLGMISEREIGMNGHQQFTRGDCCSVLSRFLPNKDRIIQCYHNKAFCGTYSQDGKLFVTACQDRNIRIYNTENYHFRLFKTIEARDMGWSILDTAFSPDGNYLIYSSWSECIHLCNIHGDFEKHDALALCPEDRRFCIFSLTFSQDGQEILGGANDGCLYVYDINERKRKLKIESHDDDVNTVAYADATSQILFSGGDDGLCKVWDRRTLSESHPKPVGILAGHKDGITFVDSRGDGRHLITNCKDQSIKLWDMRLFSPSQGLSSAKKAIQSCQWDYRWQNVPRKYRNYKQLSGDTSLMTYTGHSVLQTLIRCRFSPAFTTGQRFIYTGCASGKVIIYDALTGEKVRCLQKQRKCVRDVSWHPFQPDIVSTSWDGSVVHWTYEEEDESDDSDHGEQMEPSKQPSEGTHWQNQSRYNLRQRPMHRMC